MHSHKQSKQQQQSDGFEFSQQEFKAADGGVRAWIVCLASFLTICTSFAIMSNVGFISDWLITEKQVTKGVTGGIMASMYGCMFLFSFPTGILTDKFGVRKCGLLGAACCTAGFLASSFSTDTPTLLFATFSLLIGVGISLAFTPSLVILGDYFDKRLGLANGIVMLGGGLGSILLAFTLKPVLLNNLGLSHTFLVFCGFHALIFVYAATWKAQRPRRLQKAAGSLVNRRIWRNRGFVLWCIACSMAFLGIPVLFVFAPTFVRHLTLQGLTVNSSLSEDLTGNLTGNLKGNLTEETTLAEAAAEANATLLAACVSVASTVARIVVGKLADVRRQNCVQLQQLAFLLCGICALALPLFRSVPPAIVFAAMIGFGDGAQVTLFGPVAFHLVGADDAPQALGCNFFLSAVPISVGPIVAGLINDATGRWDLPFYTAGAVMCVAAAIMTFIPCQPAACLPCECAEQKTQQIEREMR